MINIYCYENKINGKMYVGQTKHSLKSRAGSDSSNYKGCIGFYRAICKYGIDNFTSWIFDIASTQEEADQIEIFWIAELRKSLGPENVYNAKGGGNGGTHDAITRKKISDARKGMVFSEEHIKNLSESHKGIFPSEITRKKLSEARSGSKNHLFGKFGVEHPLFGIKRTIETCKKVSEATKGKQLGSKHAKTKLTEEDVLSMRKMYADGLRPSQILPIFNDKIKLRGLKAILYRTTWKHI